MLTRRFPCFLLWNTFADLKCCFPCYSALGLLSVLQITSWFCKHPFSCCGLPIHFLKSMHTFNFDEIQFVGFLWLLFSVTYIKKSLDWLWGNKNRILGFLLEVLLHSPHISVYIWSQISFCEWWWLISQKFILFLWVPACVCIHIYVSL